MIFRSVSARRQSDRSEQTGLFAELRMFDSYQVVGNHADSPAHALTDAIKQDRSHLGYTATEHDYVRMKGRDHIGTPIARKSAAR